MTCYKLQLAAVLETGLSCNGANPFFAFLPLRFDLMQLLWCLATATGTGAAPQCRQPLMLCRQTHFCASRDSPKKCDLLAIGYCQLPSWLTRTLHFAVHLTGCGGGDSVCFSRISSVWSTICPLHEVLPCQQELQSRENPHQCSTISS